MPLPSLRLVPRGAWWAVLLVGSAAAVATSTVASYGVRAATVLLAAVLMVGAARRRDGLSRTRRLVAAALLVGAASGAAAAVQALVTGGAAPVGSWTDCVQLLYIPFAVAGLVAIPATRGERIRTVADVVVAAGSLWYLAVALVLEPHQIAAGLPPAVRFVTLSYLLGPPLVIAVVLSLLPSITPAARSFLLRAAGGMALVAVADLCFALAAWHGTYRPASWIAALQQAGLVILLHAAVVTRRSDGPDVTTSRSPDHEAAEAFLPYLPLAVALTVAVFQLGTGGGFTRPQTFPLVLIGAAVVVRHGAAMRSQMALVRTLEDSERSARHEARLDPLTGLPNRKAFVDHLGRLLTDPAANPVAVGVLDLNDFKHVNDNHGHAAGDRLLEVCAERLAAALAPDGVVARLGGDEFAVCMPGAHDDGRGLVDAVLSAFDAPVVVGRRHFTVRPSVGVVVDERLPGPAAAGDAPYLLAHADVAMYQAKEQKAIHRSPAVVLTGPAREHATALIRMQDDISQPELAQFRVVYQPVVDLATGEVAGVEALLRWRHPTFGDVGPAEFVPLAEHAGSIAVLGRYVIATALADAAGWNRARPDRRLTVRVNLSPRQLADPDLVDDVLELVDAHGLTPEQLVLEITEGALMRQFELAVHVVARLRATGVSVAVDDFGTGHSSLRYLRRFAADEIKIDKEFIQAMPTEARTGTLVRLVVELATALELRTVAEGIESVAHLRAAQALGVELGQGFLFSAAVDAAAIGALVTAGHRYPTEAAGTATAAT